MIRNILAAGALALTVGGLAAATPAMAQRGDDVVIVRHEGYRHDGYRGDGYRGDGWRREGRWHRPPPPRCRTIIRERETRRGIVQTRERVCRGY